jgi:hypothetical protein
MAWRAPAVIEVLEPARIGRARALPERGFPQGRKTEEMLGILMLDTRFGFGSRRGAA